MGSREDAWDTSDAGNEDMIIRAPFVSAGTGKGEEQGLHKFRYAVSLPTLGLLQQWTVVGAYGARAQLWRNHNGTSSTPPAELRVEHELGGLASDNVRIS